MTPLLVALIVVSAVGTYTRLGFMVLNRAFPQYRKDAESDP